jgi:uncharacterized membrane protein
MIGISLISDNSIYCTRHMLENLDLSSNFQQVKIAITIAIIIGIGTTVFFLMVDRESYSAIYLIPDSITHNPGDNTVIYVYGVISSESQKTDYIVETYLQNKFIDTKQFSLNSGETIEEQITTVLPSDVQFPEKITLVLNTGSQSESVHFWIRNQTS